MVGKGRLEEGYDGDIVLVDLDKKIQVEDENTDHGRLDIHSLEERWLDGLF